MFKALLKSGFEKKDLGRAKKFLGMKISRDRPIQKSLSRSLTGLAC